jgi:hypothetical protein
MATECYSSDAISTISCHQLKVIPLTVFNLGRFEAFVDIMSVVTFIYWAIDLPGRDHP